ESARSLLRRFGLGLALAKSIRGIRLQIRPNLRRGGLFPRTEQRDLVDRTGRTEPDGEGQFALAQVAARAGNIAMVGLTAGLDRDLSADGAGVRCLAIANQGQPDKLIAEFRIVAQQAR